MRMRSFSTITYPGVTLFSSGLNDNIAYLQAININKPPIPSRPCMYLLKSEEYWDMNFLTAAHAEPNEITRAAFTTAVYCNSDQHRKIKTENK